MNKIINLIVLIIYIIINSLFIEKYVSRITPYHISITITYILVVFFIIWLINKFTYSKNKHSFKWLIGISIILIIFAISLQYIIDPMSLNVDRWSAIHNFLSGMLNGKYPYGQQTHLGGYGSPFPIWQILHLPFYAIGNVGLSIIVVTTLFIWTIYKIHSTESALITSILLCISPAFFYEIAVRSDLITNIMLSAIIVEWLIYKKINLTNNIIFIGILTGLILSTRLIAIIPICVIYGYEFLQIRIKKQCLFILSILITFSITFLPFILWEGSTLLFFEYNPFILQTRQGSWLVMLVFAFIAISTTIVMRKRFEYRLIITGFILTSLVIISFIEKMWKQNLWSELFSSTFDITYLSVALPFYITHLSLSLTKK